MNNNNGNLCSIIMAMFFMKIRTKKKNLGEKISDNNGPLIGEAILLKF